MIGLIIVAIFAGYIILLIAVISVVYKKTKNIKKMFIALAIMILIPTWDVIIGYPIYKFLCATQAGVHIYKTVDNVEGFYVGEKEQRHEPHEPYDGYKYLDYKEIINNKPTGKYYRSYWLDNNTSELCVHYGKYKYGKYADAYRNGRCVAKEEIDENEVSRWEIKRYHPSTTKPIPIFYLYKDILEEIFNNSDDTLIAQFFEIRWAGGWLYGFLSSIETGHPNWITCNKNDDISEQTILKPKKQEEK